MSLLLFLGIIAAAFISVCLISLLWYDPELNDILDEEIMFKRYVRLREEK